MEIHFDIIREPDDSFVIWTCTGPIDGATHYTQWVHVPDMACAVQACSAEISHQIMSEVET